MNWSTSGFPVLHHLPEVAQTYVHWMDAIQPSHLLSSSFPPAFNLSQHQGLFQWVGSLHQVAKALEFQLKHQSFQWIFRVDFLYVWLVWAPCCPRDSHESSPALQFKSINSLALSLLYGPILTSIHDYWKNYSFNYTDKIMSLLFNMLSRFVIAFLPRTKGILISSFNFCLLKSEIRIPS